MAHIPEGVLSAPVLITGALVTTAAVAYAIRKLDYDRLPQAAVLAACFFVASLVAVPAYPSSVHLLLNGLMGLMLGWLAVPALLVALLLQAVFFGFGGLLVLGVNCLNIALPALLSYYLVSPWLNRALLANNRRQLFISGMIAGAIGVAGTGALVCLALVLSGPQYLAAGKIIMLTYLPLLLVESLITGAIVGFVAKVAPELLQRQLPQPLVAEESHATN
ncbi:cobalt transporter CbiM [Shewanella dokdonensis]|uniref:Cobalt transporter CbiM n=1 Tax=Shewanella dokdonensis TaxID=712036 RepID=A0ABX8DDW5_9GAMM|nr:cobalt transporter CbiM [Shewanella dokdonensis]QVK22831.1 cobalt transporter CbiM [Shewanella dokdonensis]